MVQVCNGQKSKQDMINQSLEQYKEMFMIAKGNFDKVVTVGFMPRIRVFF